MATNLAFQANYQHFCTLHPSSSPSLQFTRPVPTRPLTQSKLGADLVRCFIKKLPWLRLHSLCVFICFLFLNSDAHRLKIIIIYSCSNCMSHIQSSLHVIKGISSNQSSKIVSYSINRLIGKRYAVYIYINGNATFVMQDLLQQQWGGRFMSHVARTTTRWISMNASPGQCFSTKKSRSKEKDRKRYERKIARIVWESTTVIEV